MLAVAPSQDTRDIPEAEEPTADSLTDAADLLASFHFRRSATVNRRRSLEVGASQHLLSNVLILSSRPKQGHWELIAVSVSVLDKSF
jgi:hypothetical protein